ncbi:MAG: MotA/TolQ/ExbB proton channel family protein [Rhodocyclaceae bacterium]|nr:MotA/TolQ/ExbB proton channel family protein [Zoogloeaceae bacterium]
MNESLGFAHFLANADGVARGILLLLAAASIGTWYLIAIKSVALLRQRRTSRRFIARFWQATSIEEVEQEARAGMAADPFSHLVQCGFEAAESLRADPAGLPRGLVAGAAPDEFLTRVLKRAIDAERKCMEYGQTYLASVASSAPFVGLFGTVWGIYHALIAIGVSGQGTLDKVAGPVGEALIMTGLGLAVAIPAALAYNFFVRHTRNTMTELNGFAHDVFALLVIGIKRQADAGLPAKADGAVTPLTWARKQPVQAAH